MTQYERVVEPTPTGFEHHLRCTGCREQARKAVDVDHDPDCPLTGGREVRTDGGGHAAGDTERPTCTDPTCNADAKYAYWMPDMGDFSRARAPEKPDLSDGDLCPYVCAACRDWRINNGRYDAERFVNPRERLVTDGGQSVNDTEQERLDVGDTRKPIVIKNTQRVTSGDLSALAMCAHLYDPADVRGWYTHDFADVVRQWICSNVESVIARLSPHCEDTRGDRPPLHPADDLWVGEVDTGPTQTTLVTDGGRQQDTDTDRSEGDR